MAELIPAMLSSAVLRTLRANPKLTTQEAVDRVTRLLPGRPFLDSASDAVASSLQSAAMASRHRGVVNPLWLSERYEVDLHYYLINAAPGWLEQLVDQAKRAPDLSYRVLYGSWDALIVLHGSESAARLLLERIQGPAYDLTYFTASRPLLYHRLRPTPTDAPRIPHTMLKDANGLVQNIDDPALSKVRAQLQGSGVLLGGAWEMDPPPSTDIHAYVGISLRGGAYGVDADQTGDLLLDKLLQNETLRGALDHLVEIDHGQPFHFLAKLTCTDLAELDAATNYIAYARIGNASLEGTTLVIASGKEPFPPVGEDPALPAPSLDLRAVEVEAKEALLGFENSETLIGHFNSLPVPSQLQVLRFVPEVARELKNREWDDQTQTRLDAVAAMYVNSAILDTDPTEAIIEIAKAAEGCLKTALRALVESVYVRDFSRAQDDLKLPSRDIDSLTLGKLAEAFRNLRERPEFAWAEDVLTYEAISRLRRFAEARNSYAHERTLGTEGRRAPIEEVGITIVDGIVLIRWATSLLMRDAVAGRGRGELLARPIGRDSVESSHGDRGIFLSHDNADSDVAARIAMALQAFGFSVFYSDWSILPGESIVERIHGELGRMHTLVVLLSKQSVQSQWVQHELDVVLMDALAGYQVRVLPVLLEDCQIPTGLRHIKYVDLRGDFSVGLIGLVELLKGKGRSAD